MNSEKVEPDINVQDLHENSAGPKSIAKSRNFDLIRKSQDLIYSDPVTNSNVRSSAKNANVLKTHLNPRHVKQVSKSSNESSQSKPIKTVDDYSMEANELMDKISRMRANDHASNTNHSKSSKDI